MAMRNYMKAAILLAILISPAAATAQQSTPDRGNQPGVMEKVTGFFNAFFNDILDRETEPDPSGTLVAPFADGNVAPLPADQRYKALTASNNVAIDQPHRSDRELGDWLMQAMAHALSFNADTYQPLLAQLNNGFSPQALEQFKTWAIDSGIVDALTANGLQLNAFVSDPPFLLNQGVIGGRFRWLYEVPVMISFVPRGSTIVVTDEDAHSTRLLITVQIGRIENSILEHGVQLESWSVRANDRKN